MPNPITLSIGTVTASSIQVTWPSVADTTQYSVSIYDESSTCLETKTIPAAGYEPATGTTFTGLNGGTNYTISGYSYGTDTNTKALLHFENGATDETGKSWSFNGNAAVSGAQAKFGTQSLYCDGSGDYILGPNNADFDFGTGSWTVEWWERPSGSTHLYFSRDAGDGGTITPWGFINANGVFVGSGGGWALQNISIGSVVANEWTHYAIVRDATAGRFYTFQGGTKISDVALSGSVSIQNGLAGPRFGMDRSGYASYNGYVDDLRISKGVARYTANFSVPTEAHTMIGYSALSNVLAQTTDLNTISLTMGTVTDTSIQAKWAAITGADGYSVSIYDSGNTCLETKDISSEGYDPNTGTTFTGLSTTSASYTISGYAYLLNVDSDTKSLLHFEDGATDDSGKTWGFGGTAAVTSNQAKFGTQSLYCDGSGWLQTSTNVSDFNLSDDFTIEMQIKTTASTQYMNILSLADESNSDYWMLWFDSTDGKPGITHMSVISNIIKSTQAINDGQWHHIAITRSGSTIRFFVDGTITATSTSSEPLDSATATVFKIGRQTSSYPRHFNGYIDEFRVSKGVARWVDSFSAPTSPYVISTAEYSTISNTLSYPPTSNQGQYRLISIGNKIIRDSDNKIVIFKP